MMLKRRRLVILSVPFTRLHRVLLAPHVLGVLRVHYDVLIVSPFGDDPQFREEFDGPSTRFLRLDLPDVARRRPDVFLYGVSESLRTAGFWGRFRDRLSYYLKASRVVFGNDGDDRPVSRGMRALTAWASVVGRWRWTWRVLDRFVGPSLFGNPGITGLAGEYENVTLVQSAQWGTQDRALAWLARRRAFRTVLLPYTSDQIACNGYLTTDFDAVCVQGPFEAGAAVELQNVAPDRIHKLGSAWFRHIDRVLAELPTARDSKTKRRVIMYAGHSRPYFPRTSELMAVDTLLAAIKDGAFGDAEMIYRPVVGSEEERETLIRLYGQHPLVRLQFPQGSAVGMHTISERRLDDEVREYVCQLLEADIVVMSYMTSLSMDASYLGRGVVANFADPSGVLARRNTQLLLEEDACGVLAAGLPTVHSLDELIPAVRRCLEDRPGRETIASNLVTQWDYHAQEFDSHLIQAIDPEDQRKPHPGTLEGTSVPQDRFGASTR